MIIDKRIEELTIYVQMLVDYLGTSDITTKAGLSFKMGDEVNRYNRF